MSILELGHVRKSFGELAVIRDLSFTVGENTVFGLIGKNGSGKTTTMKMILGLLRQSGGEIRVCGEKVAYGGTKTNRHIGYLPDVPEFYGFMKPAEYLRLCGEIAGLKPAEIRERSGELLELVGLKDVARKIGGFSRGMKQRLGIAQALLGRPRLLVCDEPTSALDPPGRREVLDILAVARRETSIVFSTHILSDVERVCDNIGILDGGSLVLSGKLEDIRKKYRSDTVRIEPYDRRVLPGLADKLRGLPGVNSAEALGGAVEVRLAGAAEDSRHILELLARENIAILKYDVLEPSLEDVFMGVIR